MPQACFVHRWLAFGGYYARYDSSTSRWFEYVLMHSFLRGQWPISPRLCYVGDVLDMTHSLRPEEPLIMGISGCYSHLASWRNSG